MTTPELPNDYELKQQYEFSCAKCGYEQMAQPSIMMHGFGLNAGHGSCLECGTFLHLMIDIEKQIIVSQDWEEWLAETAVSQEAS